MEEREPFAGYRQNKLPLIPMEGKVQINSYSHFNAFMLMQVQMEKDVEPTRERGELKLTFAPEKSVLSSENYIPSTTYTICTHTLEFEFDP